MAKLEVAGLFHTQAKPYPSHADLLAAAWLTPSYSVYSGGVNEDVSSFPSLGHQESSAEKMTFELGLGGYGAQTTRTGERKKLTDTGRRRDNPLINFFFNSSGHTHTQVPKECRKGRRRTLSGAEACLFKFDEGKEVGRVRYRFGGLGYEKQTPARREVTGSRDARPEVDGTPGVVDKTSPPFSTSASSSSRSTLTADGDIHGNR